MERSEGKQRNEVERNRAGSEEKQRKEVKRNRGRK
jgi:hypothetical protein